MFLRVSDPRNDAHQTAHTHQAAETAELVPHLALLVIQKMQAKPPRCAVKCCCNEAGDLGVGLLRSGGWCGLGGECDDAETAVQTHLHSDSDSSRKVGMKCTYSKYDTAEIILPLLPQRALHLRATNFGPIHENLASKLDSVGCS